MTAPERSSLRIRCARGGSISAPLAVCLCGLALLGLALSIAWRMHPAITPHAPPSASNPDQPIAALVAEFRASDGASFVARLTPLHADAGRQAFESAAMRERLALPEGEPWRLSLRRLADAAGAASPVGPVELGPVEVRDEVGLALSSIPRSAAGAPGADPLRALVRAPSGPLQAGQSVDWILWGRAPTAHAHLAGLAGASPEFTAQSVRRSELSLPLARLDRSAAAPGKNAAAAASGDEHEAVEHH